MSTTYTVNEFLTDRGFNSANTKVAHIGRDWSVSPGHFIADRAVWEKMKFNLREMLPEGAIVKADGLSAVVRHPSAYSGILEMVSDAGEVVFSAGSSHIVEEMIKTMAEGDATITVD
jgi:hypothetical protein